VSQGAPKKSKDEIKPSDLHGLKDLGALSKLLESLHGVGTERDRANNRQLHMDQYCLLVAMWLFNPIIDSLRGLQQASTLDKVRKRLGVGRASLGSLSESVTVFDPQPLAQIAQELADKIPDRTPDNFQAMDKKVTAVDGSIFEVLAQVARLAWLPKGGKASCGYRLHAQFEVFRGIPSRVDLTPSKPKGDADERAVLEKSVEAGRCYLLDRGYYKFALLNTISHIQSDYVCRTTDRISYEVVEDLPLSEQAVNQGILSDQIVRIGTPRSRTLIDHTTRLVIVKAAPHDSRRKRNALSGPNCDGYLRILTNNLEIPTELVSELYLLRWTIEIYFRLLKQLLGCRHLLSYDPQGATIQMYMAIIACILILSLTGKLPTKRTYEMVCFYLAGWASIEELERHIKKLK
jgi:hypothetical protein